MCTCRKKENSLKLEFRRHILGRHLLGLIIFPAVFVARGIMNTAMACRRIASRVRVIHPRHAPAILGRQHLCTKSPPPKESNETAVDAAPLVNERGEVQEQHADDITHTLTAKHTPCCASTSLYQLSLCCLFHARSSKLGDQPLTCQLCRRRRRRRHS